MLVAMAARRLRPLGLAIPDAVSPEAAKPMLWERLSDVHGDGAHAQRLGARATTDARVFFTGGATAVLLGWRQSTFDVGIEVHRPDADDAVARLIPALKEEVQVNVEYASPSHYLPELPSWEGRSRFIARHGSVEFLHYDFHAQALAKAVRNIADDASDVRAMLDRGLVTSAAVRSLFAAVEPQLYRFPSLDPATVRRHVEGSFPPE